SFRPRSARLRAGGRRGPVRAQPDGERERLGRAVHSGGKDGVMHTRYVAAVDLDRDRLAKDLAEAEGVHYPEAYSNHLIGGPWKRAMLWATGGDSGTGLLTGYAYDRAADFTEYGRRLPYLRELITGTVDVSRLQFVRLAVFSDSVIVPHRDFLEL